MSLVTSTPTKLQKILKLNQKSSYEITSSLTFLVRHFLSPNFCVWNRCWSRRNCSHPSKLPWKLVGICCSWCCRREDSRRWRRSKEYQKHTWWTRRCFVWEDRPCTSSPTCKPSAVHGRAPSKERSRWQRRLEWKANNQCATMIDAAFSSRHLLRSKEGSLARDAIEANWKTLKTNKNIYSILAPRAYSVEFVWLSATEHFYNNSDWVPVLRQCHKI